MIPRRVLFFSFLILLGFGIVLIKLITLQITNKEKFIKYIEKQYYTKETIPLPRGIIYDRNGKILAISVPTIDIFVLPQYIKNKQKEPLAQKLSPILKIPQNKILDILKKDGYVVLARNVDKKLEKKIKQIRKELKVWNLGIIESSKRYYPLKKVGASNIGFVNPKTGKGVEGLERKLDKYLGGGVGKILLMKDALGNPITIIKKEKLENQDVYTTIDVNIQYIAEEALKKLVKIRKPKEACVLILNPNTGEILANAVYPTYDPNRFYKYKLAPYKNITFRSAYEIGSLAKPFVMAKAIATGKVKPNEIIYGENGKIYVDNIRIKDHKKFGYLTPAQVVIHSSNVGIIKTALRFKPEEFYNIFESLGFGKSTYTYPAEHKGIFRRDFRPVQIAYASIGQSWTATPIQVAVAYSAIANGGFLIKPSFEKAYKKQNGEITYKKHQILKKVLSEKEVKWLKKVLKLVVEKGTAKKGKSKYYTIAGKTGTAQKYDPKIKALSSTKFYTWFAGFFPVENPKYTIVIFANEPKKLKKWEIIGGGNVSSIVLQEVVDRLMFYSKIKPDKKGD